MPSILPRFLLLALPLVLLAQGAFHYGGELVGLPVPGLSGPGLLALWTLESLTLVGLFLLVRERGLGRWTAGLATGWSAWVFRGPVQALSFGLQAPFGGSWGPVLLGWFGLYTVCGLLMASVAGSLGPGPEGAP